MSSDLRAWLMLSAVPGVGGYRFQSLLRQFGSPEAVLDASTTALTAVPGFGKRMAMAIRQHRDEAFADHQMYLAEKHQTRIVTYHDMEYPSRLREIYDPPPVLYMAGEHQPEDERAVAIVGTRITSSYGRRMAKKFSEALCAYGITIVSGLARGVDTVAHQTVLDNQGRTIAVLGSGLDRPYPYENRGMMRAISENGVVMTEQPFETGPDAVNFPQRNRIISGLSLGTIVIEAGDSSGALITARYALEHNREVFAVPGPLHISSSVGVNNLIKQGRAKLIQQVEDVIEELAPQLGLDQKTIVQPCHLPVQLSLLPEEDHLYAALTFDPKHIDQLAADLDLSISQALAVLLGLELKGVIRQLPGKRFVRE